MLFYVFLVISTIIFGIAVFGAVWISIRPYKQKNVLTPLNVLLVGTFLSSLCLFVPFNYHTYTGDALWGIVSTVLSSSHNAIRLFIVDFDFGDVAQSTAHLPVIFRSWYRILAGIEFVCAPILTLTAVLSFFEQLAAKLRYRFGFRKDAYIFSDMNDRALSLAKSIRKKYPNSLIIFNDVFKKNDEDSYEMIERVKEIGAICFKDDITVSNFRRKKFKDGQRLYFFIIGTNEEENVNQTVNLAKPYVKGSKVDMQNNGYDYEGGDKRIYLFSANATCEKQLSTIDTKHIKIRRITDVQSLVYSILNSKGMDVFTSAIPNGNKVYNIATKEYDEEKTISAIVVGTGFHGTEMIKALSWFGQMHPYRLEITGFDMKKEAAELFAAECPELFDCNPADIGYHIAASHQRFHNDDFETVGEAHYKISMYGGYDAELPSFDNKLKEIGKATYVFVSLGSDDRNIRISIKLRILFTRMGIDPVIHTVVYNHNSYDMLMNNYKLDSGSYKIHPFGDVEDTYSEESVFQSELENKALSRHMAYTNHVADQMRSELAEYEKQLQKEIELLKGAERDAKAKELAQAKKENEKKIAKFVRDGEESFWKADYNYRSSIASVLHSEYKKKLKLPGSGDIKDRTEDEKWFRRRLEHNRWNAYVRSEGYIYGPKRNKTAKIHHLLVPFDELPYEEQIKDDD